jgi:hypothetical protein
MRGVFIGLSAASVLAAPAAASIPPVGWEGPEWVGPGLLCGPSFTLKLKVDERAEQQYPSVGFIRYIVRSEDGIFEVAEDWFRRVPEGRVLRSETQEGLVFKLTGEGYGRSYLFQPKAANLPFQLRFDPLMNHPPSFILEDEQRVLERLSFATPDRQGCLPEEGNAKKGSSE